MSVHPYKLASPGGPLCERCQQRQSEYIGLGGYFICGECSKSPFENDPWATPLAFACSLLLTVLVGGLILGSILVLNSC